MRNIEDVSVTWTVFTYVVKEKPYCGAKTCPQSSWTQQLKPINSFLSFVASPDYWVSGYNKTRHILELKKLTPDDMERVIRCFHPFGASKGAAEIWIWKARTSDLLDGPHSKERSTGSDVNSPTEREVGHEYDLWTLN